MASEIDRLRRKRGGIRSMTTKLLQKIEAELGTCEKKTAQEWLDQVTAKEIQLKELDKDIEPLIKEDADLDAEVVAAEEYRERTTLWKTRILLRIKELDGAGSTAGRQASNTTVKLPRLVIEKYSGDARNWQSFWDQFEAAVDKNPGLSEVDKFNYLRSYLGGRAESAITGLALTSENYKKATKILQDRFGNKEIIISAHMTKLLSLTPVKNSSDVFSLRKLYDASEVQIRSLESLGVKLESYGALLCPIIIKIIPDDLALEFTKKRKDKGWNVSELLKFLQEEVESREQTQVLSKPVEVEKKEHAAMAGNRSAGFQEKSTFKPWRASNPNYSSRAQKSVPSAAAFSATLETKCIFCEDAMHDSEACLKHAVGERKTIVRKQGRCFVCLRTGHIARFCRSKKGCNTCGRKHSSALCEEKGETSSFKKEQGSTTGAVISSVSSCGTKDMVLLQTARALAVQGNAVSVVRCLLDGGSQRTFVREDISRNLNLPVVGEEKLDIHTFGNDKPETVVRRRVKLTLRNLQRPDKYVELEALESPRVCGALIHIPGENVRREMRQKGLQLADDIFTEGEVPADITVLLGADYYWSVVTGQTVKLSGILMALESIWGWSLHGPTAVSTNMNGTQRIGIMNIAVNNEEEEERLLSDQLRSFWELDSIGIMEKAEKPDPLEEEAQRLFDSTIEFKEEQGRYEVGLPWKIERETLQDNYIVAKKRLKGLIQRFKRNVPQGVQYIQVIDEYLKQGIVEEATESEMSSEKMEVYYLPHHGVVRDDKTTTKLRVVFDASSHAVGCSSLNDCLYSGANLTPELLSILIKFRENRIAFTADIEQAFLQIMLRNEDRNAVRFLWFDGPFQEEEIKMRKLRMTRVLFGVTSSPFLLAATIKHHISKFKEDYPETVQALDECLYVDDFISGAADTNTAYTTAKEAKEIMMKAGMTLRKWQSNSPELNRLWNENSHNPEKRMDFDKQQNMSNKVLGLIWKTADDTFSFDIGNLLQFLTARKNTKRYILQASARIYDPVGFVSPFVVRAKFLFQELWERGIDWDEDLPSDIAEKWNDWCVELPDFCDIVVPRYYFSQSEGNGLPSENTQLHCFCDASEKAYGAVIYLRYITPSGSVATSFVVSKTRVAPLKKVTLPRLELMAAVIGTRLMNYVTTSLRNAQKMTQHFWTDSMITYHWIRGSAGQWKPFVANRVGEIQTSSEPRAWSHCKGADNPADILSRGKGLKDLATSELWWNGPAWLSSEESDWPIADLKEVPTEATDELKKSKETHANSIVLGKPVTLLKIENFSNWSRLMRVTGWVYRFINNTRTPTCSVRGSLTVEELRKAEIYWVRQTQSEAFPEEVNDMKKGKTLQETSRLAPLNPIVDEMGLLRVKGRLQNSNLDYDEQHPIILPEKSPFVNLLVKHCHAQSQHSGVANTLTHIRERYWIMRGRQVVKSVIHRCLTCKRWKVQPANEEVAPLPHDRISKSPPFQVTGIDFAGPLYVKGQTTMEKAYIVLFTCAVTRAVHLELTSNMSTEHFLMAFRRFISRRGLCHTVYSDNAKTFKRGDKDLKEMWKGLKTTEMQDFFGSRGIHWKYIVEKAAWWGGFWERMVQSVKTGLKKTLGKASLTFEEIETTLAEVEAILNSRPLTYTYSEVEEPTPLTPAHFLIGKRLTSLPAVAASEPKVRSIKTKEEAARRLKYRQTLIDRFWRRWKQEYLLSLRSAHFSSQKGASREVKKGDVVLIGEENLTRAMWKVGIVEETFPGRDGKVRACAIRLPNRKIMRRPVQLLYPLELSE